MECKGLPVLHVINNKLSNQAINGKNLMIHWIFLGGLSMSTRCIAYQSSPYYLRELALPFLNGVMQDGVVILQALTMMAVLRMLLGLKSWITTLAMLFCNLVPFIDILVQFENYPRLNFGFVINLCYNFQIVYVSLAATFTWPIAILLLVWLVFITVGVSYLTTCAKKLERKTVQQKRVMALLLVTYIGWAICLASYKKQDPSMMYVVENPIFKMQHEPLPDFVAMNRNTQHQVKSFVKFGGNIVTTSEIYKLPELLNSTVFPTLRKTIGYQGPKLFDVNLHDQKQPNVLLIMMEGWRDLGPLGPDARHVITPEFEKLRSSGISFDAHYTPSIQTSRTFMSNLFGNLPENLDEAAIGKYPHLNLAGLPQLMKAKGYHNEFVSAVDLSWDKWNTRLLRHGFDQLMGINAIRKILRDKKYTTAEEGNGWGLCDQEGFDGLYERMMDLNATDTKAFINFYSISSHHPFTVPSDFEVPDFKTYNRTEEHAAGGWDRNYFSTLAYSDQQLGRFIAKCRQDGLLNNTIVLIQGDHGGPNVLPAGVLDEATHVPALLLADGHLPEDQIGKSFSQVSSQTDVFATMADIIGIPKGGMWNHGIGSSMVREEPDKKVILLNQFIGKTIGVRQDDLKIVQKGLQAPQVFNLSSDPLEMHPLSSYNITKVSALIETAHQMVDLFSASYKLNQFVPRNLTIFD